MTPNEGVSAHFLPGEWAYLSAIRDRLLYMDALFERQDPPGRPFF
jgi:hypothetical protein